MNSTTPGGEHPSDLVAEARDLRERIAPWLKDQHWLDSGKRILYAVDTNVLMLFSDPWLMSPARHRVDGPVGQSSDRRVFEGRAYTQIFAEDSEAVSIAIGYRLAEEILFNVGLKGEGGTSDKRLPLLLIPPLDIELDSILLAIGGKAVDKVAIAQAELLQLRERLRDFNATPDEGTLESLLQSLPALVEVLVGERGAVGELRRFDKIFAEKRVASVARLKGLLSKGADVRDPAPLLDALTFPDDLHSVIRRVNTKQTWFERLRESKSSKISDRRILHDAMVMAWLEEVNERLVDKNAPYKIVFVTGDHALTMAASAAPQADEQTFAHRFLRHPRAFLAAPGVLTQSTQGSRKVTTESTGNEIALWLDTFIAAYSANSGAVVNGTHEDDFRSRWRDYTRALTVQISIGPSTAGRRDQIRRIINSIRNSQEGAAQVLEHHLVRTWSTLVKVSAESSVRRWAATDFSKEKFRPRNPPLLRFGSFEMAETLILEVVSKTRDLENDKGSGYEKDLAQLRIEDPTGYTQLLCFGVIFAALGHWSSGVYLASHAINPLERSSAPSARVGCSRYVISGREAYYLRAVCLRHLVQHPDDLSACERNLIEAQRRFEEERHNEHLRDLTTGKKVDARFQSEQIAIELTRLFFKVFEKDSIDPLLTASQSEAVRQILGKIETILDNSAGQKGHMETDRLEQRLYLERDLLTNYFSCQLLLRSARHRTERGDRQAAMLSRLRSNLDAPHQPFRRSFLVNAVALAARATATDDGDDRQRARNKVKKLLSNANIQANRVMPYDEKRFLWLRSFAS